MPKAVVECEEGPKLVSAEFVEMTPLFRMADTEFERVKDYEENDYFFLLTYPQYIEADEKQVDRIMSALGSTKGANGEWKPVCVLYEGETYKVWGKTEFCG
jgi:hypothetical protein